MSKVESKLASNVCTCQSTKLPIDLSYDTFGSATDPAVLLVMGLNGQGMVWPEEFCSRIAKAGYFVIRFDNRDVGFSTKFDDFKASPVWQVIFPRWLVPWKPVYTLEDMARDACALLDYLKIDKAHWIGTSMGGMISQTAAIIRPDKVLSLTSIVSTTGNTLLPPAPLSVRLSLLKSPGPTAQEEIDFKVKVAYDILIGNFQPDETGKKFVVEMAEAQVNRCRYRKGGARQILAISAAKPRDEALNKLNVPSLIIHGTLDPLVPVHHGVHTAACIPGSQLKLVTNCGHYLGPWTWDEMMDSILPFLDNSTPPKQ